MAPTTCCTCRGAIDVPRATEDRIKVTIHRNFIAHNSVILQPSSSALSLAFALPLHPPIRHWTYAERGMICYGPVAALVGNPLPESPSA
eukprot:542789-Hanusia_phi.AAC.1